MESAYLDFFDDLQLFRIPFHLVHKIRHIQHAFICLKYVEKVKKKNLSDEARLIIHNM
jgi:hypothetical protein